ncbi:ComEA family DNA-binding protein [Kitasatospora sp. NPDC049258]|uniref:ComEA family DNA-binding protein n=1 Tax=Kitasatospora sp. NPDC049258 TaxID=3155394 RepID=UPI0034490BC7
MRTMTPGAARRRETSEAVRDRMANLFTVPPPPAGAGAPALSAGRPPEPPPEPAPEPAPGPAARGPEGPPGPPAADRPLPPAGPGPGRWWPGLPPGLLVDRRAVLGLSVLLLLAVGYGVQHFWLGRPQPVAVPTTAVAEPPERPAGAGPPGTPSPTAAPSGAVDRAGADGSAVVVDVAGRVLHPGLRRLPGGSRVADAVAAAGGPVPGTDTESLNLARVLTDGEQILVGAPAGQGAVTGSTARAGPLSLNRATAEQLDTLPGVGPTLAQRIIQFRQEHGAFRSVDQLRQVSGIGDHKYEELKALLSL